MLATAMLPTMAQQWVAILYNDSHMLTEDWIETYCTEKCKMLLQDEYRNTFDAEGYATWMLEGDREGEDVNLVLASVESLGKAGKYEKRLAVNLDAFPSEEMVPSARRTIVLDLIEEDGDVMVDSIEYPRDDEGLLRQRRIERKQVKLPQEVKDMMQEVKEAYTLHPFCECMNDEPEVAHCLELTRNSMEPGTGLAIRHMTMHGTANEEHNGSMLRCVNIQTYHPDAETLNTEYETAVYTTSNQSATVPMCHFSSQTLYAGGKKLTLEQTFYFSAKGDVMHAERHLIDSNGKEQPIDNKMPISDGKKELKRATQLCKTYSELMDDEK